MFTGNTKILVVLLKPLQLCAIQNAKKVFMLQQVSLNTENLFILKAMQNIVYFNHIYYKMKS